MYYRLNSSLAVVHLNIHTRKYNASFVFSSDKIVVETPPEDTAVESGSTVLLSCFVPDAKKITWFKDGKQLLSTQHTVGLAKNKFKKIFFLI